MPAKLIVILAGLIAVRAAASQVPDQNPTQPQVKVNVLNVCTPSAGEQKEIASALDHIPGHPSFSSDFEVSRGRSTLTAPSNLLQPGESTQTSDEPSVASYVRIRHELAGQSFFSSVQYSFSNDGQNMVETLVFHVRDPKELIQVSLEDSASSIGSVAAMLALNTPASRVRLERFGKPSVALARCTGSENSPAPDQSAYQPLFRRASAVLADYRRSLGVHQTVPQELAKVSGNGASRPAVKRSAKSGPGKNEKRSSQ